MTTAAFKATYSDWKPVKSRRVIQVVFEVPWEKHDEAYQALGGMCDPGKERWFGIARLNENTELRNLPTPPPSKDGAGDSGSDQGKQAGTADDQDSHGRHGPHPKTPPRLDSNASAGADKERRKFDELSPPQQAGILSSTYTFGRFLAERFVDEWHTAAYQLNRSPLIVSGDITAQCIRILCNVKSRADIKPDNVEFKSLLLAYRLWQNHPELEDA